MADFFSKLFGRSDPKPAADVAVATRPRSAKRKRSGRRETPTTLDWSKARYVPLPPSPRKWEVDARHDTSVGYSNPALRPVYVARDQKQYTKVVKLASGLSEEQLQGHGGEIVAEAYRHVIRQRSKAGQLNAAAQQSLAMFEKVPSHTRDKDKRSYNKIIGDMDKAGTKHHFEPVPVSPAQIVPLFTLTTETSWTLEGEQKLAMEDRPDPSFEIGAVDRDGTWLLRTAKTTMNNPRAKSSVRRIDRTGRLVAERELLHDTYRVGKGSSGSSIAIMDSDGELHIYDADVNLLKTVRLENDPRVVDHFRTIETGYWGKFKTQIRAVDVAPHNDMYLFTLADEAWCCTLDGRSLWGVVMPLNEGWERAIGRSERVGTSAEVDEALRLFGLSLPVSPAEIKSRKKALVREHHPDTHRDDPDALERMKQVNIAFELLTGVDPDTLDFEESDVTYFRKSGPDWVINAGSGIQIEVTMSTGVPQDWVYAAAFDADQGRAFVATYSGRVVLVTQQGDPVVVYDLGICPNEILDNGRYTYFLTDTRLYVVEDDDKLAAILDVFQQGRLIVSEDGFGLLTDKMLQWFTLDGTKLGSLETRDPIRAIYATGDGAVIQTRQHQVAVQGLTI